MIPISVLMGWITSVAYVSALSLWALVSGRWAAWRAARVEVNQEPEEERRKRASRERSHKHSASSAPRLPCHCLISAGQ